MSASCGLSRWPYRIFSEVVSGRFKLHESLSSAFGVTGIGSANPPLADDGKLYGGGLSVFARCVESSAAYVVLDTLWKNGRKARQL